VYDASREVDERFHAVLAFARGGSAQPEDVGVEVVASEAMVVACITKHQVLAVVPGQHVITSVTIELVVTVAAREVTP